MIGQARTRGDLNPGQMIIEATTGNTGIARAVLGRRFGHPVRVVVPENVIPDVGRVLSMYGTDIEWVAGDLGIRGALDEARRIADRDGAFLLN
jgi:cysteine synthase B